MDIATISRDLTAQKRSEAELLNLADRLEHRVIERTAELAEASKGWSPRSPSASARMRVGNYCNLEVFRAARLNAAGQMAAAGARVPK